MKTGGARKATRERRNPNHPRKGSRIVVDPIQSVADIKAIKSMLSDKPRDLLLFTIGINNGLRAGDLLRLKVKDLRYLKEGDGFNIREMKTKKDNILMVNKPVYKALRSYLEKVDPDDEDSLFPSRKRKAALLVPSVNGLIKKWTKSINLRGNYGAHTLRKTFGYIQRTKHGVSWEILADRFKHSTPAVTRHYLGITTDEVRKILLNEI
jgi:integrase